MHLSVCGFFVWLRRYLRLTISQHHNDSFSLSQIFQLLESNTGLFEDYTLTQTSLEHIFCGFANEQKDEKP